MEGNGWSSNQQVKYFKPSPVAPHPITRALTAPQFALRLAAKGEVTLTLGRPSKHWLPYVKVTLTLTLALTLKLALPLPVPRTLPLPLPWTLPLPLPRTLPLPQDYYEAMQAIYVLQGHSDGTPA